MGTKPPQHRFHTYPCVHTDNPESTPQYCVLVKLTDKIVESLSHEPITMAQGLLSSGFISKEELDETIQLNDIKSKKAARLYSAVLGVVEKYPHKLDDFVSLLQARHIHQELVKELERVPKQ